MLVILTDRQILSTKQVCDGCLMADSRGLPRWRQGKLCCGHLVETPNSNSEVVCSDRAKTYRCQMGFQVAEIK
jgi:hypothetical protein